MFLLDFELCAKDKSSDFEEVNYAIRITLKCMIQFYLNDEVHFELIKHFIRFQIGFGWD